MAEIKKDRKTKTKIMSKKRTVKNDDAAGLEPNVEDLDLLEDQNIHLEEVKKMNYREVSEIIHFFQLENDEKKIQELTPYLEKLSEPAIELAPVDLRVWSFFYDKYILRIALAVWTFVHFAVIQKIFKAAGLFDRYMLWQDKIFSKSPNDVPAFFQHNMIIPFFMGIAVVMIGWRVWMAHLESKRNKKGFYSTPVRRKIRIVIVNSDGTFPGFWKSFIRGLFKAFPLVFITLLTMQFSKNGRGIHDKLLGTYSLKIREDITESEIRDFIKYSIKLV